MCSLFSARNHLKELVMTRPISAEKAQKFMEKLIEAGLKPEHVDLVVGSENNAVAVSVFHTLREVYVKATGWSMTERLTKVIRLAQEEARRLYHEYIGTEHLLLGLLREGEGYGVIVLGNLGFDSNDLVVQIEDMVKRGKKPDRSIIIIAEDLPFTSRAKKVLELAKAEKMLLNHPKIDTEHLLLGLLREQKGIAAQVLQESRLKELTVEEFRTELCRVLGRSYPTPEEIAENDALR